MADEHSAGAITDAEILAQVPAARRREARARAAGRRATSVRYDGATHRILVELSNGYLFGCPVDAVPALAGASADQLAAVEVSPGGSGLHWEALDVDLSVAGLVSSSLGRVQRERRPLGPGDQATARAKSAAARARDAQGPHRSRRGQ